MSERNQKNPKLRCDFQNANGKAIHCHASKLVVKATMHRLQHLCMMMYGGQYTSLEKVHQNKKHIIGLNFRNKIKIVFSIHTMELEFNRFGVVSMSEQQEIMNHSPQ